ncbi:MAG TPA: hypothetical protein VL172_06735, partial [Kofleriaceae bacterium]|nr:hypothetical protein [Kofleriaceae bacterium]
MNLQQVEVKVYCRPAADAVDPESYIAIFHRWIQENRLGRDFLLIDVADYRHVPDGPGVMIIAHGAHWKLDEAGGELGLAFARKRDPLGPAADKLTEAFTWALRAAAALEKEPALAGKLSFRTDRVRVAVISRAAAAGTPEDFAALRPDLEALAARLWP